MHADSFLLQLTPPDTLSSLDCMHARLPVTAIIIIPMRATEARLKQIERAALTVRVLISYRGTSQQATAVFYGQKQKRCAVDDKHPFPHETFNFISRRF